MAREALYWWYWLDIKLHARNFCKIFNQFEFFQYERERWEKSRNDCREFRMIKIPIQLQYAIIQGNAAGICMMEEKREGMRKARIN